MRASAGKYAQLFKREEGENRQQKSSLEMNSRGASGGSPGSSPDPPPRVQEPFSLDGSKGSTATMVVQTRRAAAALVHQKIDEPERDCDSSTSALQTCWTPPQQQSEETGDLSASAVAEDHQRAVATDDSLPLPPRFPPSRQPQPPRIASGANDDEPSKRKEIRLPGCVRKSVSGGFVFEKGEKGGAASSAGGGAADSHARLGGSGNSTGGAFSSSSFSRKRKRGGGAPLITVKRHALPMSGASGEAAACSVSGPPPKQEPVAIVQPNAAQPLPRRRGRPPKNAALGSVADLFSFAMFRFRAVREPWRRASVEGAGECAGLAGLGRPSNGSENEQQHQFYAVEPVGDLGRDWASRISWAWRCVPFSGAECMFARGDAASHAVAFLLRSEKDACSGAVIPVPSLAPASAPKAPDSERHRGLYLDILACHVASPWVNCCSDTTGSAVAAAATERVVSCSLLRPTVPAWTVARVKIRSGQAASLFLGDIDAAHVASTAESCSIQLEILPPFAAAMHQRQPHESDLTATTEQQQHMMAQPPLIVAARLRRHGSPSGDGTPASSTKL